MTIKKIAGVTAIAAFLYGIVFLAALYDDRSVKEALLYAGLVVLVVAVFLIAALLLAFFVAWCFED